MLDEGQSENAADQLALDRTLLAMDDSGLASSTEKRGNPPGRPPKCRAPLYGVHRIRASTRNAITSIAALRRPMLRQRDLLGWRLRLPVGPDELQWHVQQHAVRQRQLRRVRQRVASGTTCLNGTCAVPPPSCSGGLTFCSGACRDLQNENVFCGTSCENAVACGVYETCTGGVCEPVGPPCTDCY